MALAYSMKDYFFDRAAVVNAVTDGEARALSKIGAYIRQAAKFDFLRRRQRSSVPGEPPSVHSRDNVASLRNIQFAYEPGTHSVVIGSVLVRNVKPVAIETAATVPQLMEMGGSAIAHEERGQGMAIFSLANPRRSRSHRKEYRSRAIRYLPRPYVEPAMQREIRRGTVRDAFRGMVVGD